MKYSDKLKSPKWQKKRLEMLERDNFTCQCCGDTETMLHVHHKKYEWQRLPWEYPDSGLITVCNHCHLAIHAIMQAEINFNGDIRKLPIGDKMPAISKGDITEPIFPLYATIDTTLVICSINENNEVRILSTIGNKSSIDALIEHLKSNHHG